MQKNNLKLKYFIVTAAFIAIVIVQNFVPFVGYINWLPGMPEITIIPATVALAGALLGAKRGALIGGVWGLSSFILAWTMPVSIAALMFRNPFTALIPRILIGFFAGWLTTRWVKPAAASQRFWRLLIVGAGGSFINTVGFVLMTWIGFSIMQPQLIGIPDSNVLQWLITTVVTANGLVELVVNALLVPMLAAVILPYAQKQGVQ